jgi:hypothetical protein
MNSDTRSSGNNASDRQAGQTAGEQMTGEDTGGQATSAGADASEGKTADAGATGAEASDQEASNQEASDQEASDTNENQETNRPDLPSPIAALLDIDGPTVLNERVNKLRDKGQLTRGDEPGDFFKPGQCYIFVVGSGSIEAVLGPRPTARESNSDRERTARTDPVGTEAVFQYGSM